MSLKKTIGRSEKIFCFTVTFKNVDEYFLQKLSVSYSLSAKRDLTERETNREFCELIEEKKKKKKRIKTFSVFRPLSFFSVSG